MPERFSLEVFAAIPWGGGPEEIPEVLEDYPAFAEMSDEQMRKVRAPVRIRLDGAGNLYALADAPARTGGPAFVYHFDASGKLRHRTPIAPLASTEAGAVPIVDYAITSNGSTYLLEQNSLRKWNRAGEIEWTRMLAGNSIRLLTDGRSRVYVADCDADGEIAELDPASGETMRVHASGESSDAIFMDPRGVVHSVIYFPETRRRGLAIFDPASGNRRTIPLGSDAYGWLANPLGVDTSSNLYVWQNAAVARLSPDGRITLLAAFNGVAVRPDGAVISSRLLSGDDRSLTVEIDGADRMALPLPDGAQAEGDWRLIHIDRENRYFIFGGEAPGEAGTILVYSSDGRLEATAVPPSALLQLESRLENHRLWTVDGRGRVYLPITDGHGFKVLRLVPAPRGNGESVLHQLGPS